MERVLDSAIDTFSLLKDLALLDGNKAIEDLIQIMQDYYDTYMCFKEQFAGFS